MAEIYDPVVDMVIKLVAAQTSAASNSDHRVSVWITIQTRISLTCRLLRRIENYVGGRVRRIEISEEEIDRMV